MQHPLRSAPLIAAVCLIAALFAAPAANAAAVDPQLVPGNPNCASLGLTTITKFDPVTQSSARMPVSPSRGPGAGRSTVVLGAVDAVIVKGGNAANVYQYPYDFFADTGLVTPDNASGGPAGISHIEFCTDGTTENPPANPASAREVRRHDRRGGIHLHVPVRGDEHRRRDAGERGAHRPQVRDDADPRRAQPRRHVVRPGRHVELHVHRHRAGGPAQVNNTAEICADYEPPSGSSVEVCDEDTHTYTVPPDNRHARPGGRAREERSRHGGRNTTVTYTFKAKNTGNVTLSNVVLTDNKCAVHARARRPEQGRRDVRPG